MHQAFRSSDIVPPGFQLESVMSVGATTEMMVRPKAMTRNCPECGVCSSHIHGRHVGGGPKKLKSWTASPLPGPSRG